MCILSYLFSKNFYYYYKYIYFTIIYFYFGITCRYFIFIHSYHHVFTGRSSESTPANYLNNQITLFLSTLADEIVIVLKRLFGSSLIEISSETAFELLAVKSEHVQQLPLATITDSAATAPEINR